MAAINRRRVLWLLYLYNMQRKCKRELLQRVSSLHTLLQQQRRRLLHLLALIVGKVGILLELQLQLTNIPRRRSCCRFIRNSGWWETVRDTYSDSRFKEAFRISRGTFNLILDKIHLKLEKKNCY